MSPPAAHASRSARLCQGVGGRSPPRPSLPPAPTSERLALTRRGGGAAVEVLANQSSARAARAQWAVRAVAAGADNAAGPARRALCRGAGAAWRGRIESSAGAVCAQPRKGQFCSAWPGSAPPPCDPLTARRPGCRGLVRAQVRGSGVPCRRLGSGSAGRATSGEVGSECCLHSLSASRAKLG